jgi:phage gp36-like protein
MTTDELARISRRLRRDCEDQHAARQALDDACRVLDALRHFPDPDRG